jgi:hypothetical protein
VICRKCGAEHEGSVGFKAVCEACGAWLHCCLQCRLYNPRSDRCTSSTTDPVRDRDGMNYCEEFQPSSGPARRERADGNARDRFMGLFEAGRAEEGDDG